MKSPSHAGCLCVLPSGELLLVSRRNHPDCLTIPKGHIEKSDANAAACAVRETVEEAGAQGRLGPYLGECDRIAGFVLFVDSMSPDGQWLESEDRVRVPARLESVLRGEVKVSDATKFFAQQWAQVRRQQRI